MIFTEDYSRVAAYGNISPDEALRILGITGTGSLAGDKSLLRGLMKKYHPDIDPSKEAKEKLEAVVILNDVYLRNGRPLPTRAAPRQQPSRTQQPSPAGGMSSQVQRGYELAGEFLNLCNSWLSNRTDCRSIKEDLRNSLFKDFEGFMKSVNTASNRKTQPNFVPVLDKFELVYDNFLRLVNYCRANKGESQLSGYVSNLKTRIEELLR